MRRQPTADASLDCGTEQLEPDTCHCAAARRQAGGVLDRRPSVRVRFRPAPRLRSSACYLTTTLRRFASCAQHGFPTTPAMRCASRSKRVHRQRRSWSVGRRGERITGPSGRARRSRGCGMGAPLDSGRSITAGTPGAGSATRYSPPPVRSASSSPRSKTTRSASSGAELQIARTPDAA
jgi:hypothetical protein